MLLWLGVALILIGLVCFAFDRKAVHYFHDHVTRKWFWRLHRTTDWAKGAHWLTIASVAAVLSWSHRRLAGDTALAQLAFATSVGFLACLAAGSAVLHSMKFVLGRRRPRDELEHSLYGLRPFNFSLKSDSFPSGHALTIFCVAVVLCGVAPRFAPLWLAVALYLGLTRAFLNAHFLSDVFVGAGIGVLAAREVLVLYFPALAQSWF